MQTHPKIFFSKYKEKYKSQKVYMISKKQKFKT
jgi:hypothetical protein